MASRGSHQLDELARAVRARREELGLTQKELSLLAGCGVVFLYDLERGKATVRLDKLLDVLEVLGLGLRLVGGSGPLHVDPELGAPGLRSEDG